jgi:hypothetical protein
VFGDAARVDDDAGRVKVITSMMQRETKNDPDQD